MARKNPLEQLAALRERYQRARDQHREREYIRAAMGRIVIAQLRREIREDRRNANR